MRAAAEVWWWVEDLRRYGAQLGRRSRLRQHEGADYTSEEYRDAVRRTVARIHPPSMHLRISEVIRETSTASTLRFHRLDGPIPPFRAGQYISLAVALAGIRTSRPLSISSAPGEDHLDVTICGKAGGFVSSHLQSAARPGDELTATGPFGRLIIEPLTDRGELVFLGGGCGVAPLLSMIRHQQSLGWPKKLYLIYGCRTLEEVIFRSELDRLSAANGRLSYALVLAEPDPDYQGVRGLISAELIRSHVGPLEGKTFFVCGPRAMVLHCLAELARLGVPRQRVRTESYGPPEQVSEEPGWPPAVSPEQEFTVEVAGLGRLRAKAGEPLLCALERNTVLVPARCRSGVCSDCRLRLVSGRVFMPADVQLRAVDRQYGYIHACMAYPLEDLVVEL